MKLIPNKNLYFIVVEKTFTDDDVTAYPSMLAVMDKMGELIEQKIKYKIFHYKYNKEL